MLMLIPVSEPLMSVTSAVKYLRGYALPLTLAHATAYLRSLWHSVNLRSLYRHYFPHEFAASTASPTVEIEHTSSRGVLCFYSPQEKEFLHLVDEKLFPFYIDYLLEETEEREDVICIPNFGVDWWSYGFEELDQGWQLLLLLVGSIQTAAGINLTGYGSGELQAVFSTQKGQNLNWEKFKAACEVREEPLCYLPLAFEMLDHDTGNIFLDPTDETPAEPLEWSIEDMDFLIEQYRQASAINEKAEKLLDWLSASPFHLCEVINLWNQCLETPIPQEKSTDHPS